MVVNLSVTKDSDKDTTVGFHINSKFDLVAKDFDELIELVKSQKERLCGRS